MIVSRRVTPASIAWSTYPRDRRAPKTPSELPDQVRLPKGSPDEIPRIRVLNRGGSGGPISTLTMSSKAFSERHFDWGETRLHEHTGISALFFGGDFWTDKTRSLLFALVPDLRIPPLLQSDLRCVGGFAARAPRTSRERVPSMCRKTLFRVIARSIPPRYGLGDETRRNLPAGGHMTEVRQ